MAFSFLTCICCCFWQKETEADPVYDETTRLIPEEPAIDVYALPNIYALIGIDHKFVVLWFLGQPSTRGSMSGSAK